MLNRIQIGDSTFNVQDIGSGPAILFVHGFPLDHTMWRHQVAEFSRDHRCLAPDLRGFGQSGVTDGVATMEQFADDLAALLDALHITEPIIFCGLSMGGCIAFQFVLRHAARLKALILCDARAANDSPEGVTNRLKLADEVLRTGPKVVADIMLPRLLHGGVSLRVANVAQDVGVEKPLSTRSGEPQFGLPAEHLADELRQVILTTPPTSIAAAARGLAQRIDARSLLPTIQVPTLVIVGDHDLISPPAEMSEIAAAIPHAEFVVISNSGHMAPMENHAEVNRAIRRFVAHN